jgi:hypothetical protein
VKKADAIARSDRFLGRLEAIRSRAFRVKNAKRGFGGTEAEERWVFEMLAVNLVSEWTIYVEDVFYACINKDSSKLSETLDLELPAHLALPMCQALFATGRALSLSTGGDLMDFGAKYIGASHPFKAIPSGTRNSLDDLGTIRNYVVHPTRVARNRYKKKVLTEAGFKNMIHPGTFLMRSNNKASKTRLDLYIDAAERAAHAIKGALNTPSAKKQPARKNPNEGKAKRKIAVTARGGQGPSETTSLEAPLSNPGPEARKDTAA